ncbi:MAG TPA: formylglycine-generating enzyme family protein [Verrucomicrobiae bacterium]|nr:formylglycine-generating enzyme family protein [Verrucomicrobiae bacterium]
MSVSGNKLDLTITSDIGTTNQIQIATNLFHPAWADLATVVVTQSPYSFSANLSPAALQRFYRVVAIAPPSKVGVPSTMVLIPAGSFQMGDTFNEGAQWELPVHTVTISAFYLEKYEVSKGLWDRVKGWSSSHGYAFDNVGSGKGTNHPVQTINWYDMVKWCNARSEMEGRQPAYYTDAGLTQVYKRGQVAPYVNWKAGYRLPTEAEWERAARGGASGHRFPWTNGDTISHSQANYYSDSSYAYDVSPTRGYNPAFNDGVMPYTSPVGSFAPNPYGIYDMAGNVWEWCWDWSGNYSSLPETDPRGPDTGSARVGRGGNWNYYAEHCRDSYRYGNPPTDAATNIGFRCALAVP